MIGYEPPEKIRQDNFARLAENPYTGRGIVLGLNGVGDTAIQIYWLMGRSEGSRSRVLVNEPDPESVDGVHLVRTAPHNLPEGTDTSLIIYNAMRSEEGVHIVSNGDQTDTIINGLRFGDTFEESLETRNYEPDAPNYTPRISGFSAVIAGQPTAEYGLSIIRKVKVSDLAIRASFGGELDASQNTGVGECIHTYTGDGNPLPSFDKSPYAVPLGETIEEIGETYWDALNRDNRVALAVKGIRLATGEETYKIINAHVQ